MLNTIYESRSMDINQADWNICPSCENRVKTSAHDLAKCEQRHTK